MIELKDCENVCDFCGKSRKFSKSRQIALKIDKNSPHQYTFGMMCHICDKDNIRKTVQGQSVKIGHRNRYRDESSIFDEKELEI